VTVCGEHLPGAACVEKVCEKGSFAGLGIVT